MLIVRNVRSRQNARGPHAVRCWCTLTNCRWSTLSGALNCSVCHSPSCLGKLNIRNQSTYVARLVKLEKCASAPHTKKHKKNGVTMEPVKHYFKLMLVVWCPIQWQKTRQAGNLVVSCSCASHVTQGQNNCAVFALRQRYRREACEMCWWTGSSASAA